MWKLGHAIISEFVANDVRTATGSSGIIDISDYVRDLIVILHSDQTNGADVTLTSILSSSNDSGMAGGIVEHTFDVVDDTAGGSHQAFILKADEVGKYIRVVNVLNGTSPSFGFGMTIIGTKQAR